MRRLSLFVMLSIIISAPAFSGTDVPIRDSRGTLLQPSQIDKASISKTCGDCHDIKANAGSVHFNRSSRNTDPESSYCLTCHLPTKDAFNAEGTIKKTTTSVDDRACITCHSDLGLTANHVDKAHDGMKCIDCHKDAGHKNSGAASCKGCHFGKGMSAPTHPGIPALHLERIACASCHITRTSAGTYPGYVTKGGKIVPLDETGAVIHHGVGPVSDVAGCWGKNGCTDCHSANSRFFFGTTITQNKDGESIKLANWKSMGADRDEIEISIVRESLIKRYGGWLVVLVLAASVIHYLIFGPHKVHATEEDPEVQRFTLYERIIHWLAILFFAFLSVSGIMFLLHRESPASVLRPMHGQVGVAFVLVLIALAVTWWRHAVFTQCDKEWICKLGGYLWIKGDCPAGKFNAGQKAFFWIVAVFGGLVISGTGIGLIFGAGRAPSWSYTLHDVAAIAFMAGIVGHVYLGIFANPGTVMSIITGRVKRSWAEKHHSEWAKKIDEEE